MISRLTWPISNSLLLRKTLSDTRRRRSRPGTNRTVFMTEALEARQCLSAVSFASHDVFNEITEPVATFADLDNDGDMDIVAGSGSLVRSGGGRLSWFENVDGQGDYGSEQIITTNVSRVTSIEVVDIDADGDLDVVSGSQFDGKIALYENINGMGEFGPQQIIESGNQAPFKIRFSDIDADGDTDLIASFTTTFIDEASGNGRDVERIAWYANTGGGHAFGAPQIVSDRIVDGHSLGVAVEIGDIDADGDQDLVVVSSAFGDDPNGPYISQISWMENTDGKGSFGSQHLINTIPKAAPTVGVGDMDGDGDLDVVTQSAHADSRVSWYANTNGAGVFGDENVITNTSHFGKAIRVGDMDNDGDQDVVFYSGIDNRVAWSENADGLGTFDDAVTISTNLVGFAVHVSLELEDFDGDDDLDVLVAFGTFFKSFENSNGSFEQERTLDVISHQRLGQFLGAVDIDSDGDTDVVSVIDQDYWWRENIDGSGTFGEPQFIATADSFAFGDADGDGDQDYFATTYDGNESTSTWVENDGTGHFGAVHELPSPFFRTQTIDLDGDGNVDVIASPWGTLESAYYKNDGNGDFAAAIPIPSSGIANGSASVHFVDMDQDGDLDVLHIEAGAFDIETKTFAIQLGWQEFTGGETLYGEPRALGMIRAETPIRHDASVSDFDGDGDLDLLLSQQGPRASISWVENVDGTYQFENQRVIHMAAEQPVGGPPESLVVIEGVHAVDIDSDGDVDVLSRNTFVDFTTLPPEQSGQLLLFENLDGMGHFLDQQVLASGPFLKGAVTADLDGDSDVDFLWIDFMNSAIGWYENRPAGDSNSDGVFNSEDLVMALAAGEYEDGIDNNSAYEEGDWNGDGDFDSGDIVFAFKAGTYEAAAQARTVNHQVAALDSLFAGHEDRKTRKAQFSLNAVERTINLA